METKLARIKEIAKQRPNEVFTSIGHLINVEMLLQCHKELDGNKAVGVDGVTKAMYEENLRENITSIVARLKKKSYKPQPVRRTFIPKGDGKSERPLGIPAYEDKLVQLALNKILQSIYEADFLECSYGFRPQRSCHQALKALNGILEKGKINHLVEVDIKGFFDNVDHEWLIKFISHRISDPNVKRLILRFLKAGIMEKQIFQPTDEGTPQGAIISPTLANVYLHYVLDLWFEKAVKKNCRGQAEMVRYADDFVCCFQYKDDAERFYSALINRLAKFSLEIAEDKTKVFMFGRYAEDYYKSRNLGKPETFDFLGFTHYCSKSKNGKFRVKLKTSKKKFNQKVQGFKEWLKAVRHSEAAQIMKTTTAKLIGHFRYYGITDNITMLKKFRQNVTMLLFKWLNRRSQRRSFSFEKFQLLLKRYRIPYPKIYVNIYK